MPYESAVPLWFIVADLDLKCPSLPLKLSDWLPEAASSRLSDEETIDYWQTDGTSEKQKEKIKQRALHFDTCRSATGKNPYMDSFAFRPLSSVTCSVWVVSVSCFSIKIVFGKQLTKMFLTCLDGQMETAKVEFTGAVLADEFFYF